MINGYLLPTRNSEEPEKWTGLSFDGNNDYLITPPLELAASSETSFGLKISAWMSLAEKADVSGQMIVVGHKDELLQLKVDNRKPVLSSSLFDNPLSDDEPLPLNEWVYLEGHLYYNAKKKAVYRYLYKNGDILLPKDSINPIASNIIDTEISHVFCIGGSEKGNRFVGKIRDVRIWDAPYSQLETDQNKLRSSLDLKNSMYLDLTGREKGLSGYYRMGAIAERQVVDFSVYGNNAQVFGNPFVSESILYRNLKDGTPVVKFINEELFSVSEGAIYEESFEFKVEPSTEIKNLFDFDYWGKKSRDSEEIIRNIKNLGQSFEDMNNGWFNARCRFAVPKGANFIRAFGISNVNGNWQKLRIEDFEKPN